MRKIACKTILGKYTEKLEREIKKMNKEIELLYKKLDAQDKIIDEQALEISQLKNEIKMRIEYAEKYKNEIIGSHKKIAQLKDQKKQVIEKLEEIELYDEYITIHTDFIYDLKNILGEKEIEEIPQFKGTLEELDNLTLGDKE